MLAPLPGCKPSPHIDEDGPPIIWQARSGPVLSKTAEMLSVATLRTHQRGVCPLFFQPLVRLKWLVSQHLWSQRKAPRQWKPSKQYLWPPSQLSPLHPSLSNPLASFALDLTLKGQIISIQWGLIFQRKNVNRCVETDLLIGSRQLVKCGIKAPCSGLPGKALQLALGRADLWHPDRGLKPASLNSCLQRHSLPPHQYMFTAPSCCQRGTDFGFLGAEVSMSQMYQYQHHSYSCSIGKLVWKAPNSAAAFRISQLLSSHCCSHTYRAFTMCQALCSMSEIKEWIRQIWPLPLRNSQSSGLAITRSNKYRATEHSFNWVVREGFLKEEISNLRSEELAKIN